MYLSFFYIPFSATTSLLPSCRIRKKMLSTANPVQKWSKYHSKRCTSRFHPSRICIRQKKSLLEDFLSVSTTLPILNRLVEKLLSMNVFCELFHFHSVVCVGEYYFCFWIFKESASSLKEGYSIGVSATTWPLSKSSQRNFLLAAVVRCHNVLSTGVFDFVVVVVVIGGGDTAIDHKHHYRQHDYYGNVHVCSAFFLRIFSTWGLWWSFSRAKTP